MSKFLIKQDFYKKNFDRKLLVTTFEAFSTSSFSSHKTCPLEPEVVGLVALLVLVGVAEPELGCFVALVSHPWVVYTSSARVFLVTVHFLVEEVGNPSLEVGGFHNGSTT